MQRNELILATHYPVANILDCRFMNPNNRRIGLFRSVEEHDKVKDNLMLASRHVLDKTDRFADVRQIIPYVVISKDIGGKTSYAVYSRSAPTEERLKNQCSLGFGGHIDAQDVELNEKSEPLISLSILNSIFRELEEEFGLGESDVIHTTYTPDSPFMLLSDLSPVDCLHVGIVFEVRVQPDFQEVIEHGLNFIGWFTKEQLITMSDEKELNFETWSQAVLEHGLDRLV